MRSSVRPPAGVPRAWYSASRESARLHYFARSHGPPPTGSAGCAAIESEAVLPFAAAADLLTPFHLLFDNIPGAQRQALEIALALADGPPPNSLAACAGALGVLAAAGDERPLVVLIDDLQWIDSESRQLMIFVARRLATEHVAMLFAARDVPGFQHPISDLPTLRLAGLEFSECELLARCRGLTVRPRHP